jgi:wyosine [tRNA(Phe)-imidazoG37] synthetase (radical SAM superfamily)
LTCERREYVEVEAVIAELSEWLQRGEQADYITLAGSGEPTLHSRFGEVIRFIRDHTSIPVALLTNGTLLHLPEVRKQALQANVVKATLSSSHQDSFARIHRPCPEATFERLFSGESQFRREFSGSLWLEVFLLEGINSEVEEIESIADAAFRLKPDRIHLNTCVRPPADSAAMPLSMERLAAVATLFKPVGEIMAEFRDSRPGELRAGENAIFELLRRRPCTTCQIAAVFGMHPNEVAKHLGALVRAHRIHSQQREAEVFFLVKERSEDL